MLYLSLKALHIVAVISWMAGMLYLPRLFIYHHDSAVGGEASNTFKIMERRLAKVIMAPALVVTWLAGLALIGVQYEAFLTNVWIWLKVAMVFIMTAVHMHYLGLMRRFDADERPKSSRYFRILNEIPTALMIFIVILVIFKPFGSF